jgi:hypothetical membrane protein
LGRYASTSKNGICNTNALLATFFIALVGILEKRCSAKKIGMKNESVWSIVAITLPSLGVFPLHEDKREKRTSNS